MISPNTSSGEGKKDREEKYRENQNYQAKLEAFIKLRENTQRPIRVSNAMRERSPYYRIPSKEHCRAREGRGDTTRFSELKGERSGSKRSMSPRSPKLREPFVLPPSSCLLIALFDRGKDE